MFEKLLVTGGCGFIGSHFIKFAFEKWPEIKIVNLDALTYAGNKENLREVEENKDLNYKFVYGNICDEKIVRKALSEMDGIVHFAAETHVDRSILDSDVFVQTDVLGTYTLLKAVKESGVKRFLHVSTDEVYGSIEKGSFKETDTLNPKNPYSATKTAADRIAYSFFATYNVPVVIARPCNNFGPNQFPEKLIPLFSINVLHNKKVPLYGTGKNIREWIFVKDNCDALSFLLEKGVEGEVYNVGSGMEKTNLEITKKVLEVLGKDDSLIEFVKDRIGHDLRYSLDTTKLRKLGWKSKTNFDSAMKQTVEWYKENEKWWKPLLSKRDSRLNS